MEDTKESIQRITLRFETHEDFEPGTCAPSVDTTSVPGEVGPTASIIVQDEIGDGNLKTPLSDLVQAKKEFVLGQPEASSARLIMFGRPR